MLLHPAYIGVFYFGQPPKLGHLEETFLENYVVGWYQTEYQMILRPAVSIYQLYLACSTPLLLDIS